MTGRYDPQRVGHDAVTIYTGGRSRVVCDGSGTHFCIWYDGTTVVDGKCENWSGGCPAKALRASRVKS